MKSFTVDGYEFAANGIGTFRHVFYDFRIRIFHPGGEPGQYSAWLASRVSNRGITMGILGAYDTPELAAEAAIDARGCH